MLNKIYRKILSMITNTPEGRGILRPLTMLISTSESLRSGNELLKVAVKFQSLSPQILCKKYDVKHKINGFYKRHLVSEMGIYVNWGFCFMILECPLVKAEMML